MKKTILLTLFFLLGVALSAQDSIRVNVQLFTSSGAPVPDYTVNIDDYDLVGNVYNQLRFSNSSGFVSVDVQPQHTNGYIYVKSFDCQSNTYYSDSIFYNASSGKDTLNSSITLPCIDSCAGAAQVTQNGTRTYSFTHANPGYWTPSSSVWTFSSTSGPTGTATGHSFTRTFNYSPVYVTLESKGCVIGQDTLTHSLPLSRDSLRLQLQLTENLVGLQDYEIFIHHDSVPGHTDTTRLFSGINGSTYWGSIPPYHSGDMYVEAIDCLGNSFFSDSISFDLNTGVDTLVTSIDLPCADECVGSYSVSQDNANTFTFRYLNNGVWRPNTCNWTFSGHGSSSNDVVTITVQSSPMFVTLMHKGCVIAQDTITVAIGNNSYGEASFVVDTVNSFGGQVVIWNTSTDTSGSRADSTAFFWDFGDGSTSNQAFPTHQFAGNGPYLIQLTQSWYLNGAKVSQDVHRDSLGMDSTGQIIYKNGFLLRVLDPNGFSLEELTPDLVRIYPQPAGEWIQIEADREINSVELVDLNGRMLKKWTPNDSSVRLDVSSEMAGYYLVRIETESGIVVKKCILR